MQLSIDFTMQRKKGVGLDHFEKRLRELVMAKFVEMVKNSPLIVRKKGGGYQVLDTAQKDPFVKGIPFSLQYCASAEVTDKHNSPALQEAVYQLCESAESKSLRKTTITVKAHCLCVTDTATKVDDSYPIFLVAYCGGHEHISNCFFFIHKTKIEKTMRVEVFRCSNASKVKAITLTIAKAFNISYKAWLMKQKAAEKASTATAGNKSPALQGKALKPPQGHLAKMALGIVTGGNYTPPAPRKPPSGAEGPAPGRSRSGSFGDKPAVDNVAVMRVTAHNQATGSTHNVTVTDEFDQEFQELAESRAKPDVLKTSFSEGTDSFSLDDIMSHMDIGGDTN